MLPAWFLVLVILGGAPAGPVIADAEHPRGPYGSQAECRQAALDRHHQTAQQRWDAVLCLPGYIIR